MNRLILVGFMVGIRNIFIESISINTMNSIAINQLTNSNYIPNLTKTYDIINVGSMVLVIILALLLYKKELKVLYKKFENKFKVHKGDIHE